MNTNNPTTPTNNTPDPNQGTTTTSTVVNPTGQNTNQSNETPNRKFVIQTLAKHLSDDQIKQILADPDLNKGYKDDRVEKLLLPDDEDKLKAYKDLNVKDLPFD